jgi:glycopeptide antibiotics resistance protein
MRSRHHLAAIVLTVYLVLLLVVLLAPTSDAQSSMVDWLAGVLRDLGAPRWLTNFGRLEVVMNAAIIAPVTVLASVLRPSSRWQEWTAYGFVGSLVVETIQLVLLPSRHGSFSDVVANTLGALLGAVVFKVGRALRR